MPEVKSKSVAKRLAIQKEEFKPLPEALEDCHKAFIEWFKERYAWGGGSSQSDHTPYYEVFMLGMGIAMQAKDEHHKENMKILRQLLWLNHGCDGLYGDDGEMQCNRCLIDFKRDDPVVIHNKFVKKGIDALKKSMER